jgi:hypothetical protein
MTRFLSKNLGYVILPWLIYVYDVIHIKSCVASRLAIFMYSKNLTCLGLSVVAPSLVVH